MAKLEEVTWRGKSHGIPSSVPQKVHCHHDWLIATLQIWWGGFMSYSIIDECLDAIYDASLFPFA